MYVVLDFVRFFLGYNLKFSSFLKIQTKILSHVFVWEKKNLDLLFFLNIKLIMHWYYICMVKKYDN